MPICLVAGAQNPAWGYQDMAPRLIWNAVDYLLQDYIAFMENPGLPQFRAF